MLRAGPGEWDGLRREYALDGLLAEHDPRALGPSLPARPLEQRWAGRQWQQLLQPAQQMQKGVGGLPPPLGPGGDEHNFLERVKAELAAASGMNGSPFGKKLIWPLKGIGPVFWPLSLV